ncbi:IS66 family insertion sequence element accessory protein TnpA [Azoarcus olearius]|uniref:Transposase n=1 Tax=Azoarcus sp. (strain BH72) TaxID=418699 RepID=A1K747_AZOSB|nr:hypothetical protein [Azoarcus olearius]CAL94652.1 conserved hypothetical protein [Azoarcus olearius]
MAIEVKGKWRRRSRAQWRAVLERFGAGGLGVVAFCEREGISVSSFRRWRNVLADAAPGAPDSDHPDEPGGFVDAGVLGPSGAGRPELRLDLGRGVVLHLVRG